jgi:hypothetical protein
MARIGKQIPSSLHGPIARRLLTIPSRTGLSGTPGKQKKTDRRRGKKIRSSLHSPIARRLLTKSSRTGLSDILDKQHKANRRHVMKMNHGIVEKILLVLCVALVLLGTILLR